VINLFSRREIDVLQRIGDVDHPADVHVDARAAQQPAKDDQVALKV
jgi:hypothetical protein